MVRLLAEAQTEAWLSADKCRAVPGREEKRRAVLQQAVPLAQAQPLAVKPLAVKPLGALPLAVLPLAVAAWGA